MNSELRGHCRLLLLLPLLLLVTSCWTPVASTDETPTQEMFINFMWEHKLGLADNHTLDDHEFLELLETLKLGSLHNDSCSSSSSSSSDHGHSHRRRRRRSADEFEAVETCLTGSAIATAFGINISSGLTKTQFSSVAVALVQQLVGGFCVANTSTSANSASVDIGLTYLYGSLSVLVISLLATVGCVLGLCYKSRYYDRLILFFVELAVGSLVAESVLHLLPAVIEGSHSHDGLPDYFGKLLVVLGVFFLLHLVDTFSMSHGFESGHSHQSGTLQLQQQMTADQHQHQHEDKQLEAESAAADGNDDKEKSVRIVHNRVSLLQTLRRPKMWLRDPYKLCLFILLGDALHNFADGLAVGAAYVLGHSDGLRLSITVALHELAHEFADFAILLSAGFSVGAAVLLNFISALTAFIGLYVAIPLSQSSSELKIWILAFATAMFLYIALVTMMNAVREGCTNGGTIVFLIGNAGLLVGFLCVIAISIYEFYG